MPEEHLLTIPAELDRLGEVLDFVSSLIDAHVTSPQTRMQVRMAMEELYVNVARYAYPAGCGWAEIRGFVENGVVTLSLIDGGTPFDPLAKPDPDTTLPLEARDIGGLGILLVKNLVDEVKYEYRDGCNRTTLRKRL